MFLSEMLDFARVPANLFGCPIILKVRITQTQAKNAKGNVKYVVLSLSFNHLVSQVDFAPIIVIRRVWKTKKPKYVIIAENLLNIFRLMIAKLIIKVSKENIVPVNVGDWQLPGLVILVLLARSSFNV